ncbi:hypothetical protein TWF694_006411 [Orbilia ellipsospora]|uniref:F-box domain-containing protein n=1 Tax=Orbilia ellipsospora TaxID=2528407 RepID=A0AAV9XLI3_9PEZI
MSQPSDPTSSSDIDPDGPRLYLPTEILSNICPHLSLNDLKSFSYASKQFRAAAFPHLMQHIVLDSQSSLVFRTKFYHLRNYVRTVKIEGLKNRPFGQIVKAARHHSNVIRIFPRITGLQIETSIQPEYDCSFFLAILQKLACYPNFNGLTYLSLSFHPETIPGDDVTFVIAEDYEGYYVNLPELDRIFLGRVLEAFDRNPIANIIQHPPNLTEIRLTTQIFNFGILTPSHHTGYRSIRSPTFLELFLISSALRPDVKIQLKRLDLTTVTSLDLDYDDGGYASPIYDENGWQYQRYPTVTDLTLNLPFFNISHQRGLIKLFPNLCDLHINVIYTLDPWCPKTWNAPHIDAIRDFYQLKRLRSMYVPWPDSGSGMAGQETRMANDTDLKDLIQNWLGQGAEWLETVNFARGTRPNHREFMAFKVVMVSRGHWMIEGGGGVNPIHDNLGGPLGYDYPTKFDMLSTESSILLALHLGSSNLQPLQKPSQQLNCV